MQINRKNYISQLSSEIFLGNDYIAQIRVRPSYNDSRISRYKCANVRTSVQIFMVRRGCLGVHSSLKFVSYLSDDDGGWRLMAQSQRGKKCQITSYSFEWFYNLSKHRIDNTDLHSCIFDIFSTAHGIGESSVRCFLRLKLQFVCFCDDVSLHRLS